MRRLGGIAGVRPASALIAAVGLATACAVSGCGNGFPVGRVQPGRDGAKASGEASAVVAARTTSPTSSPTTSTTPPTVPPASVSPTSTAPSTPPTASPPAASLGSVPTGIPTGPGEPTIIIHGSRQSPEVALTFDSNMSRSMLRKMDTAGADYLNSDVLDILDRMSVPTTFFLAGLWVERYPEATRRIATDPLFEVGSHSYLHEGFTPDCYTMTPIAPADMAADVTQSFETIKAVAGEGAHLVPFFRFPGGCYDDTALRSVAPSGAVMVQLDVASGDAFASGPSAPTRTVLDQTRNGSIIVMHITKDNAPYTAQALPDVVQGLRDRGFTLVKLSDLLAEGDVTTYTAP